MVRPCMECLQPPIQGEVKASSNHSADDPQASMPAVRVVALLVPSVLHVAGKGTATQS